MRLIPFCPLISVVLTPLLALMPLAAQTPAQGLQLQVIESDGTQNVVGSQTAKGFTVELKDSAGSPVPDAAVAFRLPDSGATGTFAGGAHSTVAYTDSSGRAHVGGIRWSATPGPLDLRVTATKGTAHAGILIEQTLVATAGARVAPAPAAVSPPPPPPGKIATPAPVALTQADQQPAVSVAPAPPHSTPPSGKTKWIIIAVVAIGAGAGAAFAMKGKSSTSMAATMAGTSASETGLSPGGSH